LRTRGASHMQQQQYQWKGKRDDLVEKVRRRVHSIIAERLKK